MATFAEIQRERKAVVREVRRRQRHADTIMEQLERKLFSLMARKTLLRKGEMESFATSYRKFITLGVVPFEKSIVDAIEVFND